jgi:hypothetical protein
VLITAHFSPPASDTAARVQTVGGRGGGGVDLGARKGRVRVRLWGCGVVVEGAIVVGRVGGGGNVQVGKGVIRAGRVGRI